MAFLTWPLALIAAAISIPLLVLLYFLKLRRRPVQVSSTLLWRKTVQDLEVNAPFRMLRFSLLLLLQLLLFVLLLLALARPVLDLQGATAERTILVIDASASMSAADGPEGATRLEFAKAQAIEIVQRTLRASSGAEMKVVAFATSARALCDFTSSRSMLLEVINGIQPTDQPGDLSQALRLITPEMQREEGSTEPTPQLVLISDGDTGGGQSTGIRIPAGSFRFVGTGPDRPTRNVGVVAMNAKRDYEQPALVRFFARLVNASDEPASTIATWRLDGESLGSEVVDVPATLDDQIGEMSITRNLENTTGGVITLTLSTVSGDVLASDDAFGLVLAKPEAPRVLIVAPRGEADWRLLSALEATEPSAVDEVSARGFELRFESLANRYDLVVFDRVTPQELPPIPSISFGASLPLEDLVLTPVDPEQAGQRFLSWRRTHALMRYAALDQILVGESGVYRLPEQAEELARGEGGTWIALLEQGGLRRLLVAFPVEQSTWSTHPGFAIFLSAALEYLTLSGEAGQAGFVRTSKPALIDLDPGATSLTIRGPIDLESAIQTGQVRVALPILPLAGLYAVTQQPSGSERTLAVNLAERRESLLATRDRISVGGEMLQATTAAQATPREIWHWFVLAAVLLLTAEWFVYIYRSHV